MMTTSAVDGRSGVDLWSSSGLPRTVSSQSDMLMPCSRGNEVDDWALSAEPGCPSVPTGGTSSLRDLDGISNGWMKEMSVGEPQRSRLYCIITHGFNTPAH
jgi:hypothetical protein